MGWIGVGLPESCRRSSHLGNVAFLVPGVRVSLRASRPQFRCGQGAPLREQLRAQRRRVGLTLAQAAAVVGVTQWTFGLWENGHQWPQARYQRVIVLFLKRVPQRESQGLTPAQRGVEKKQLSTADVAKQEGSAPLG